MGDKYKLHTLLMKMYGKQQLDILNGKSDKEIEDNLYEDYIRYREEIWSLLYEIDQNYSLNWLNKHGKKDPNIKIYFAQLLTLVFMEARYKEDTVTS